MTKKIFTAIMVTSLFAMMSVAQAQRQDVTRHAQLAVERKMETDWDTKVNVRWTSADSVDVPRTDQVRVRGTGTFTRDSDRRGGEFSFDVTMVEKTKRLIRTAYSVTHWTSGSTPTPGQWGDQNLVRAAQTAVERKMEDDWNTNVSIKWTSASRAAVMRSDQVRVKGTGTFTRSSDRRGGDFTYDVTMVEKTKRITRTTYSVSRWGTDDGPILGGWGDQALRQKARKLVQERIDRSQQSDVVVNFTSMTVYNVGNGEKSVRGDGTVRRRSGGSTQRFTYDVRFDRSGNDKAVNVSTLQTNDNNDNWNHGDEARLEQVARDAAAAEMRKRYGDGEVSWYGQTEHYFVSNQEAGVKGKARFRRDGRNSWMDFTYAVNVNVFEMRAKHTEVDIQAKTP